MRRAGFLLALVLAFAASGCMAAGFHRKPRIDVVDGDPIVQMGPSADFRSGFDPRRVTAPEHPDPPEGSERVVALELPGTALAYPIGMLDRVEAINDGEDGASWVVTRCALTHVVAVYDRAIDGRTLTFENTGGLWRDTAVLRDRETGTYWSAATGAGLSGPLAGRRLAARPAIYTTAAAWRRAHPDSRFPELGVPSSVPLLMRLYAASRWQGVSGVKTTDRRHPAKKEFLSVADGVEALAFTTDEVRGKGRVETSLGDRPVVLEWDPRLEAARAWEPTGPDRRELAVVPMYWFALDRHFETVHTLPAPAPATSSR